MQGWSLKYGSVLCYTETKTRTHTRWGAQTDGFGTSKASQGLTKCEATRRRSKFSVFLILQRGVTLQHCISRYDTSWLVSPCRVSERKWCISFGMMNAENREKQRLKNRLWPEPIKRRAQTVNTPRCKAELIKVRDSSSIHFFFSRGWNTFFYHPATANPLRFDWLR